MLFKVTVRMCTSWSTQWAVKLAGIGSMVEDRTSVMLPCGRDVQSPLEIRIFPDFLAMECFWVTWC
jgi:hypothetical protein